MDCLSEAFLVLLRSGLWEQEPDDLSCFPLSEQDWTRLLRIARQQTVTGLVYRGICRLPEELLPPEIILMKWVVAAEQIEQGNSRMNEGLKGLYHLFVKEGIIPVLQKGQGIAQLYEEPLLREFGDIDFYFSDSEMSRQAVDLLTRLGVKVNKMPDGSFNYRWKGWEVEHHSRLIDCYNPFLQRYLKKLEAETDSVRIPMDGEEDLEVKVPSPCLNLMLLDMHIMKHAFGWGIGLRQLCDMARACYVWQGKMDTKLFKEVSRKTGITRWNSLLFSFLKDYLGLPATYLPYEVKPVDSSALLERIMTGGNFGFYGTRRLQGGTSVWARKWRTACSFLRNVKFACRYAPKEGFWSFVQLMKGQL